LIVEIPCEYSGKRPYKFFPIRYFSKTEDGKHTWLRVTKRLDYKIKLPKKNIDFAFVAVETPQSENAKYWFLLNDNLVLRAGEYGGFDMYGDKPEFLRENEQVFSIVPINSFYLRSVMVYVVLLK